MVVAYNVQNELIRGLSFDLEVTGTTAHRSGESGIQGDHEWQRKLLPRCGLLKVRPRDIKDFWRAECTA